MDSFGITSVALRPAVEVAAPEPQRLSPESCKWYATLPNEFAQERDAHVQVSRRSLDVAPALIGDNQISIFVSMMRHIPL